MVASSPTLISSQSRRGRGNSSVWLDAAENWGGGEQQRAYVKQQSDYCCRPPWRAWRKTPLLLREHRALRACQTLGLAVPEILHFACEDLSATLVLAEVADTLPLDKALAADGDTRKLILSNVGSYLARLHGAGWYHGALYAHHMLISDNPGRGLVLIDFEKARRARRRRGEDLNRFWRHNTYLSDPDRQIVLRAYGSP